MRDIMAWATLASMISGAGVGQVASGVNPMALISGIMIQSSGQSSGPLTTIGHSGNTLFAKDRNGRVYQLIDYYRGDDLMPHDINK